MGVRSYVGKVQTNPSTLYMDGTSPITVKIQATSEELRAMHNHKVLVVVYVDENDNLVEPARADALAFEVEDLREEIAALHRAISRITKSKEYFDEEMGWIGGK